MRLLALTVILGFAASGAALAQEATRSPDTPIETKTQTANTGRQVVNETPRSKQDEQKQHWTDAMDTSHSRDPRKKDEYGTPVPQPPSGHGTNSSTDAQRAADARK